MKKSFYTIMMFLLVWQVALAQDIKKESRNASSFSAVQSSGIADVILKEGGSEKIEVEAQNFDLADVTTEVKGNTLHISTKNQDKYNKVKNKKVKVTVTFKSLNEIGVSGASDVIAESVIKSSELKIQVSGAGDFKGAVEVQEMVLKVNGAGDVTISGSAKNQKISITGAGDVSAYDLKSENVEIKVAGSGDAKVNVSNSLKGSIMGAGDISYKGNPQIKEVKISGAGSLSSKS